MKLFSLLLIASLMLTEGLHAQEQKASRTNKAEVETKWPGVFFAISRLERIQDDRLLVFVRVVATSKSSRSGTFLGAPPISPNASQADVATNFRNAKPFSLASAVMTDDQTQRKYPVLPPVAPPGKAYFPSELANNLFPGRARRSRSSLPRHLRRRQSEEENLQNRRCPSCFPVQKVQLLMFPFPRRLRINRGSLGSVENISGFFSAQS